MSDAVGLSEFKIPIQKLSSLQTFQSRDGEVLSYRFYPSWSERVLVLYHGVGGDSRYMCSLAAYLSQENIAAVVTPDLRGHGSSRKSDHAPNISAQTLRNDVQDLLSALSAKVDGKELHLGGHSLGGALTLRTSYDEVLSQYFKSYLALVPYLGREPSGWLQMTETDYVIGLPKAFRTGSEVVTYPKEYFRLPDLTQVPWQKVLMIASQDDALFSAEQIRERLRDYSIRLEALHGYSHMGLVMAPNALKEIAALFSAFVS